MRMVYRKIIPFICITSPFTKCSMTVANNSITSKLRNLAIHTLDLANKKSPAKKRKGRKGVELIEFVQ